MGFVPVADGILIGDTDAMSKELKFHVGSRPWAIARLQVGESLILEAPPGRRAALMSQIQVDIRRLGLTASNIRQRSIVGVQPDDRSVLDLIRVERVA